MKLPNRGASRRVYNAPRTSVKKGFKATSNVMRGPGGTGKFTFMPQKTAAKKFVNPARTFVYDAKAGMKVPMTMAKEHAKTFIRQGVETTKSEVYKYAREKVNEYINEKRSTKGKNRTDAPGGGGALMNTGVPGSTALKGSSLFKNPALPLGTTMKSSISMGRNKLPKTSIAQPTKFDVFNTEGSVIINPTTGEQDFRKSPFGGYKKVSINQTYYELFPLCIPQAFERRLALMTNMSYAGSHQAEYSEVQEAFDNPGTTTDGNSYPVSNQRLEKYVPFNIYNKLTLNNISKVLPATVKLHFVQLKNNANFAGTSTDETSPLPKVFTGIGAAVDAVLEDTVTKDRSYTTNSDGTEVCGPGTGLFRTTNKMRWDATEPTGTYQASYVWGMRNGSGQEPMISAAFAMRTGRPFQNLPQFEDHFHIVKTSSFKIGAGNTVDVDVASHYNKCFSKTGTLDQLAYDDGGFESTINRYAPEQLLCLVEIKGAPGQAFYEYEAGATASDDPTRTWGIAKSSSANVNMALKTSYEFAVRADINTRTNGAAADTEIYSRNYLDCPGTKKVGLDVIPMYSQLATQEPETWVSGERMYIEPVRTDTTTIGAGAKVGNK